MENSIIIGGIIVNYYMTLLLAYMFDIKLFLKLFVFQHLCYRTFNAFLC